MTVFNKEIKIGNFLIAEDSDAFVIAEAGVNHQGNIEIAKKLIDIAAESGANAVKFQAFKTEELILRGVPKAPYQLKTTDAEGSQFEMLKKLEINREKIIELKKYCERRDIIFLITPFDEMSLEELDEIDIAAYKIASTDLTNLLFLNKVAKKKKPIILSTGMSYLAEVEMALGEIHPYNKDVVLLQCTANYPVKDNEVNLNVIPRYKSFFNMLVGYSDHSVGIGATPYAVAMGARVVEKHFTVDKSMEGPDHKASLDPYELREFIKEIRRVRKYLGVSHKLPSISELETRKSLQKNLVAARDIKKGELFSEDTLIAKRTGGIGISPLYYKDVTGKYASRDFRKDEIIEI